MSQIGIGLSWSNVRVGDGVDSLYRGAGSVVLYVVGIARGVGVITRGL